MSDDLGLLLRTLRERLDPTRLLARVVGNDVDAWQRDLLATKPGETVCVVASRRIGKSTAVGVMSAQELAQPNSTVIILSPTLAQSQLLFAKIASVWHDIGLPISVERRTLTEMRLSNGSRVTCIPAGVDGEGARGEGITRGVLAYDEAAFIPDKVFSATFPIAETYAKTVLISTPGGKGGTFYRMMTDHDAFPDIKRIRASALELPRMTKMVERMKRTMDPHSFDTELGLRWMGKGRPFFDADVILNSYTGDDELRLGDIYAGVD